MIKGEVSAMENNRIEKQDPEAYVPRPAWQVWAARVGLVLFILFVIYQILTLAGGGIL